jgi:hypothetical protein
MARRIADPAALTIPLIEETGSPRHAPYGLTPALHDAVTAAAGDRLLLLGPLAFFG